MIKGKPTITRSEVNYRTLPSLNCSMVKLFATDPVKFFEQFKLGYKRKDSKSTSLIIGDIVDFYLLDCKGDEEEFDRRFDEKFALFEGVRGNGQVFSLADILFEVAQQYTNDEGEITVSFGVMFSEAFAKIKSDGKYGGKTEDKALEDFYKNGYDYYKYLIDNAKKLVVDVSLLEKSKKVAKLLMNDSFTRSIFSEGEDEYYPKFPIEWVYETLSGKKVDCKSEVDIIRINHKEKKIYIKDLKTTYDNEGFEYSYLKYRYDLQAAFYFLAVRNWADENDMSDYTVSTMEFVVGDTSSNNRRPICYTTSEKDLHASLNGFTVNNIEYKGIHQIMNEIDWAEQNNIWNVSKEIFDKKGKIPLNMNYA